MNNFPGWRQVTVPVISLFTSAATLLCCALPALMVSLGMGAVMAGLVSAVPQMAWLSQHKISLFIVAAIILIISGVSLYVARHSPCPADSAQAKVCMSFRRISLGIFLFSVTMYAVGFFFAFFAYRLI